MSKSLEALEFIIDTFNKYAQKPNDIGLFFKFCEAHDKVLKDLERLETLEKENQKLKKDYNLLDTTMESDDRIICELLKENEQLKNDIKLNETQIDDLTLEVANYKHALEEKNEIIMDLKEEKEELEQQLAYECGCNSQLVDYQTAIEKFFDYLNKEPNRVISKHSIKQVFDKLLKEVFGNE